MRTIFTVILSGALSALLTYLFIRWVEERQIVAEENHRSMHKGRVPVGGGLPLLAAAFLTWAALWPLSGIPPLVLLSVAALAVVSWRDDVEAVNPVLRLATHVAAAAVAVLSLPESAYVFLGLLPWGLDRAVAGIALVWFVNLTNFMDGIDAIAGVQVATVCFGYVAIMFASGTTGAPLYSLALALMGATLGFLIWNCSPARIFLGDVGSVPLGLLMGVLMLDLATRHSLAAALILPLYFAADATITIVRRVLAGQMPWEAHRSHFYQRAAAAMGSHPAVVWRVVACNAMLVLAAVLAVTAPWLACAIAAAGVGILLYSLETSARSKLAQST